WFALGAALLVLQLPHQLAALLRGDPEAAGSIAGYVLIVAALRWTYRPLWPAARSTDRPEGTGPAAGAAADRGTRAGEAGGDETSTISCGVFSSLATGFGQAPLGWALDRWLVLT